MRRLTGSLLALFVVLGLTVAGVGGEEKKEEKKGKDHKVQMLDNKFDPKELTIEVGDTVTWVNKGEKVHTATADEKVKDNPFDTKNVKPGESSKPVEFKKAGRVPYACDHHDEMKGLIIVKEKK
jgi:plastocyanin